jgi:hypothetical protein
MRTPLPADAHELTCLIKEASNFVRGADVVLRAQVPFVHAPLTALVRFAGHFVLATALMPLNAFRCARR